MGSLLTECYIDLANAIILQAARDYGTALKQEYRAQKIEDPEKRMDVIRNAQCMILDTKQFFESKWFTDLTDLKGPELMNMIREKTMESLLKKEEKESERQAKRKENAVPV